MILSDELQVSVEQLLDKAGFASDKISLIPCAKGGNNRTFRLETENRVFALKEYFRQPGDKRDRLASEFAFLTYANLAAPNSVPFPYAQDPEQGLALYEFIEGKPITASDIQDDDVYAAAEFFCALNQADLKPHANELPLASEACFSIQEHIQLVDSRITHLQQLAPMSEEDQSAVQLIKQLSDRWELMAYLIMQEGSIKGVPLSHPLDQAQRCISPSDFGFHNALRTSDGSVKFLDFEYAGWDDPAKMVGDFFSQLAVPVPHHYFHTFTEHVMKPFPDAAMLVERGNLLRSVYRVKWCCIALNVFIPVNMARRKFANPDLNIAELKRGQLLKAKSLLQQLEV